MDITCIKMTKLSHLGALTYINLYERVFDDIVMIIREAIASFAGTTLP